jgi:HipA-like protein
MAERLAVLLGGEIIGHLERATSVDDATFSYTPAYVREGAVALSAQLPIQAKEHPASRVRPYLFGLLPENDDARTAWADQLGVDPNDAFGILATMGWDCPGAVQFCREEDLDEQVRAAFLREYVTPAGRMMSDTQTAYAMALVYGIVTEPGERRVMGERLAELVRVAGYRVATGFVGTPIVQDALTDTGHLDAAARLLLQTQCPSWLYPVTMGATTVWERWDSLLPDGSVNPGQMTSFNHYAFGAIADWLHRVVAGLAPAAPGYRELAIAPHPLPGLDWARTAHETPYGRASVGWERRGDTIVVDAPAAGHMLQFLGAPQGLGDAVRVGPVRRQADWLHDMLTDPRRARVHLVTLAEERGWAAPVAVQLQYALSRRTPERELLPMAMNTHHKHSAKAAHKTVLSEMSMRNLPHSGMSSAPARNTSSHRHQSTAVATALTRITFTKPKPSRVVPVSEKIRFRPASGLSRLKSGARRSGTQRNPTWKTLVSTPPRLSQPSHVMAPPIPLRRPPSGRLPDVLSPRH